MPFRSARQRAFLYMHKPDVARKFAADTSGPGYPKRRRRRRRGALAKRMGNRD